jgi:hypothetical protein
MRYLITVAWRYALPQSSFDRPKKTPARGRVPCVCERNERLKFWAKAKAIANQGVKNAGGGDLNSLRFSLRLKSPLATREQVEATVTQVLQEFLFNPAMSAVLNAPLKSRLATDVEAARSVTKPDCLLICTPE